MSNQAMNELMTAKDGECQCFVVFLRILLKYLHTRDAKAHEALQEKVRVCTEKAKRDEHGYQCVAKSVLQDIPKIVKTSDLRKVQAMLMSRKSRRSSEKGASTPAEVPQSTTSCNQKLAFLTKKSV